MKKYNVTIPIAGVVYITVDVPDDASKEEIYEAATTAYNDDSESHDIEWEFYDKLAEGNVLHASCNEWSYEEADND
jgi:hypothetical protein